MTINTIYAINYAGKYNSNRHPIRNSTVYRTAEEAVSVAEEYNLVEHDSH